MAKKTTTTPPPKKTTTATKKPASSAKRPTPTATKKPAPPKKRAPAKPAAAKKKPTGGGGMGIFAVIVVIAACAVVVASFFFTFFAVSLAGYSAVSVTGMQAVLGGGSSGTGDANPALLLVWFLAIVMLVALCVPPLRKKQGFFRLPIIGGMAIIVAIIGLIVLFIAYSSTMGYLRREYESYDTYLAQMGVSVLVKIGTGIGFKMAVIAQLVLLCIPIADKCLRRRE